MKKILSILGAIGLTATGVSPVLAMSPAHNTHNNQEQDLINYQKELVNAMDTIIQNDNELFIKNIIDSSLSFNSKDGKIIVDKNLISKINNEQIVNLLSDAKFEILLNKMLDDNQLIITTEGKTEFKLEENNAFTAGLWIETHWYWFGYCKIHFNHALTNTLINILSSWPGDILQIPPRLFYFFPELSSLVPVWSLDVVYVHGYSFFEDLDHGNGIGFDSYGLTSLIHYWSE